ncbi:HNH endonuclease [Nocardia abscessus]|uniref:HNH endonuclease n=1 Tax=Nocardia abscessus TaxID=120957 RepID=UPI0024588C64|nr:HNH endonuclease signature motif containing protein [Nocardia abscessus]
MQFYRDEPTARTSWRLAILMGANTRTYKFALGSALLELGQAGRDKVTLSELGSLYAAQLIRRPAESQQAAAGSPLSDSDFLSVLRRERSESIDAGQPTEVLVNAAVRSIPAMVMQKFHHLRATGPVAHTFYELEVSGAHRTVRLTPELHRVADDPTVLAEELESRWSIVEASFDSGIGRALIQGGVEVDHESSRILAPVRRAAVTSVRGAIVGFQHGRCFYCQQQFGDLASGVHVDHVFPFAWMNTGSWRGPNLNHVWNLVLACAPCNQAKSARQPTSAEIARLLARNDAIAASPHPLRRTIEITMNASGTHAAQRRRQFMLNVVNAVTDGD